MFLSGEVVLWMAEKGRKAGESSSSSSSSSKDLGGPASEFEPSDESAVTGTLVLPLDLADGKRGRRA